MLTPHIMRPVNRSVSDLLTMDRSANAGTIIGEVLFLLCECMAFGPHTSEKYGYILSGVMCMYIQVCAAWNGQFVGYQ